MKRIKLLSILSLMFFSCSDKENKCVDKRMEIIESYDRLIELAEGDEIQQAVLIRNKASKLEELGC
jgi:hypothetical protein